MIKGRHQKPLNLPQITPRRRPQSPANRLLPPARALRYRANCLPVDTSVSRIIRQLSAEMKLTKETLNTFVSQSLGPLVPAPALYLAVCPLGFLFILSIIHSPPKMRRKCDKRSYDPFLCLLWFKSRINHLKTNLKLNMLPFGARWQTPLVREPGLGLSPGEGGHGHFLWPGDDSVLTPVPPDAVTLCTLTLIVSHTVS